MLRLSKRGMSTATLSIDLDAIRANWPLERKNQRRNGAVVKANAYGLGAGFVAKALLKEGVQTFFVAVGRRGGCAQIRGQRPTIYVFGGHMQGDTELIREYRLTPLLNSVDQLIRHVETLPNHPFGIQLDTGMNRLGMEPVNGTRCANWPALEPQTDYVPFGLCG